ncbi:hypothetical protein ACFL42_01865 [Candidatus Omnitrophota bacterium]
MFKRLKNKKGVVLINAMVAVMILTSMGGAYMALITTEGRLIERSYESTAALNLAETGVEFAIWELKYGGRDFAGWNITDDGDTASISQTLLTADGETVGDYDVTVTDLLTDTGADNRDCTIESAGFAPSEALAKGERTVMATTHTDGLFDKAVFGGGDVTISGGSTVDSYDSSDGPYDEDDPGSNGDVASSGDITINGAGSEIDGDANPGPDSEVNDPDSVSGSTDPTTCDYDLDPMETETEEAEADNDNELIDLVEDDPLEGLDFELGNGDTFTLDSGTYYFEDFTMGSGSILTIAPDAEVTIYVTNEMDTSGAIVNGSDVETPGLPTSLMIIYVGDADVQLTSNNSLFCGMFYAPNDVDVKIAGGVDLYGSVTAGGSVDISGGSSVHFDEALLNDDEGKPVRLQNGSTRVIVWQEKQTE